MHRVAAGARPFPGSGPDEEEEEELSALMQKLRAANPPAEVMKVCAALCKSSLCTMDYCTRGFSRSWLFKRSCQVLCGHPLGDASCSSHTRYSCVLQVANREHKRLKKSSEHHPGYAMSRAYLETLADLPWSRFSGQAEPWPPGTASNG